MRALLLTATLCLSAGFLGMSSTASRADFSVCNSTNGQIRLAFGSNDSRLGWTSRGWWTVSAGACQQVLYGQIPAGNYYVHAVDAANRPFPVSESQVGGTFCTRDNAFDLRSSGYMTPQNTIACEANGLKGVKFRVIEVREASTNYSYSLAPTSNAGTAVVSNGAGVGAIVPVIKDAVQTLDRPTASQAIPLPMPQPQTAVTQSPARPAPTGTACQRYPNLC